MVERWTPSSRDLYLIWSHEHGGWWKRHGYTAALTEAARYTREEALRTCARAMPRNADLLGALPELPVRLDDVLSFTAEYLARHPGEHRWWEAPGDAG